jgi:hypothetical protein
MKYWKISEKEESKSEFLIIKENVIQVIKVLK